MVYKTILTLAALLLLGGCAEKEFVYVKPQYTKLPDMYIPSKTKNTYIYRECLYIDDNNTNLCGNNLIFILDVIKKLRLSNERCVDVVNNYNIWAEKQNKLNEIHDEDK